jgi:peptidyl-prolyl cis-trans isomerase D
LLKALNLRKQALDRLIDQALWSQEARRLGIQVSEDEVAAAISGIPVFQTAGIFDPRRYQAVLSQNRMTAEQFEAMQEQAMLVEKLRLFIAGGVMVSDDEARQWYNWNDTSLRIDYVLFSPDNFEDIQPTPEEIESYYREHKDNYKSEVQLKAQYLKFSPDDYVADVIVSDERIGDYYETHAEEFNTPKTVEARHILFKVDPTAGDATSEAQRKKAEEVAARARDGEDFEELAKTHSEGPTRDRGGWLGAFRREDMVKPFSDAAFTMEVGEISDPVKTQFGWHVIKVEKINEAGFKALEEVREEIRAALTAAEAKNLAYDEAVAIYDNTVDGEQLAEALGDAGEKLQQTEFFGVQGPEGVANRTGFSQAAFKLDLLGISEIEDLGDGYYIIQTTEKMPAEIQELAEVEALIAADLTKEKQDQAAQAAAGEFLEQLKGGESLEDLAAAAGLSVSTTEFFKRTGAISGLGFERQISEAAFKLSAQDPLPDEAIKGSNGYYVVRLKDEKVPDAADFEAEKATIKDELINRKQVETFEAWLAKNKSESDISIQEGFID